MILEVPRLYIRNINDEVITTLDRGDYFDDTLTRFLAGKASVLEFTILKRDGDYELFSTGKKISFKYEDEEFWLNMMISDQNEKELTVTALSLNLEMNNETTGPYTGKSLSFEHYFKDMVNYENSVIIGINEVSEKRISNEWTGTDTNLSRLFSLATVFGAELEFVSELNPNGSLKRIVMNVYKEHSDTVQGLGTDRRSETFRFGKDIKTVRKTEDASGVYTAIRPHGTDGLTVKDIEKEIFDENGMLLYCTYKTARPGFSSPHIIYAPQSRDVFPSTLSNEDDRWIVKDTEEMDYKSAEALFGYGLGELKKNCVPKTEWEIEGYIKGRIGDTIRVADSGYKPEIYLDARITEQTISFTKPSQNKSTFSNVKELQSQVSTDLLSKMEELIEANKVYTCTISSTNGVTFKNGEGSTVLTAIVRDSAVEVTDKFSIEWFKNGVFLDTGAEITVKASDVDGKAVYKFVAKKADETVAGMYEVTVTDVSDGKDGNNGRGISGTPETVYGQSKLGTTIPGTWSTTRPDVPAGEYLWTKTITKYTDNTESSVIIPTLMGPKGEQGVAGLGIKNQNVEYAKGTSGTVPPASGWSTTIPTVNANEYFWTRTTLTYTNNTSTIAYSVGKMGANGSDAKLLYLTATAENIAFNADDTPKTTQAITISAKLQNTTGTATFKAIPYIGNAAQAEITLGGSGNNRTLSPSQWTNANWTLIAITATLDGLSDTLSVTKVKDGSNGKDGGKGEQGVPGENGKEVISGYLSNESLVLPANASGTVSDFSKATGKFVVYEGQTQKTSGVTYAVTSQIGLTATIDASGTYKVTALSADSGTAIFKATYGGVSIEKILIATKAKQGGTGEKGNDGTNGINASGQLVFNNAWKNYPYSTDKPTNLKETGWAYHPNVTILEGESDFPQQGIAQFDTHTSGAWQFWTTGMPVVGGTYVRFKGQIRSNEPIDQTLSTAYACSRFFTADTPDATNSSAASNINGKRTSYYFRCNGKSTQNAGVILISETTPAITEADKWYDFEVIQEVPEGASWMKVSCYGEYTSDTQQYSYRNYTVVAYQKGDDGLPAYVYNVWANSEDGELDFTVNYPKVNLFSASLAQPYNASSTESWTNTGIGSVSYSRKDTANGGIYVDDKSLFKPNTDYFGRLVVKETSATKIIKTVLLYSPFTGLLNETIYLDGAVITGGVAGSGSVPCDISDGKEHILEWNFSTGAEWGERSYTGHILQFEKENAVAYSVEISKLKFEENTFASIYTPSPQDDPIGAYPKYMGTCSNHSETAPTDPSAYEWARIGTSPTGITESATIPTDPYVGMLWKNTGANTGYLSDVTYRWNGSRWDIYTFTAENISASTLSAICANLGTVTAGTINGVNINGSVIKNTFKNWETGIEFGSAGSGQYLGGTTTLKGGRLEIQSNLCDKNGSPITPERWFFTTAGEEGFEYRINDAGGTRQYIQVNGSGLAVSDMSTEPTRSAILTVDDIIKLKNFNEKTKVIFDAGYDYNKMPYPRETQKYTLGDITKIKWIIINWAMYNPSTGGSVAAHEQTILEYSSSSAAGSYRIVLPYDEKDGNSAAVMTIKRIRLPFENGTTYLQGDAINAGTYSKWWVMRKVIVVEG